MEDIMQSFNGCFALFSCLMPSSGYEDVMIGAKRLRIKKQVSPLEYAGQFQMSCKSYCSDLCLFRIWTQLHHCASCRYISTNPMNRGCLKMAQTKLTQTKLNPKNFVLQIAEGGYSFVFLVEEVVAGLPVEGAEFALKRVCLLFSVLTPQTSCTALICPHICLGPSLVYTETLKSPLLTGFCSNRGSSRASREGDKSHATATAPQYHAFAGALPSHGTNGRRSRRDNILHAVPAL